MVLSSKRYCHIISYHRRYQSTVSSSAAGRISIIVLSFLALTLLSAGTYVFMVNRSAVQGYALRQVETGLKEVKKKNAELRVEEAEATALSRIEAGSENLRMEQATVNTVITPRTNTVASR